MEILLYGKIFIEPFNILRNTDYTDLIRDPIFYFSQYVNRNEWNRIKTRT